jgi:hypothetical protein
MSEPDPLTDLVVSTYTPTVDRGRSMRTYGVIAAIAHHRRVEVLFKPFGDLEPSPAYGRLDGVSLQGVPSGARLARAVLYGRSPDSKL